jgi:predicted DNA-binding transcriptional regulator AlpA
MASEVLLTVEDAALRLKISKHTLNRWRVTGEGPPFVKYGTRLVRYLEPVLDEWARKRLCVSTGEYARQRSS